LNTRNRPVTIGISWKKFHADVLAAMLGRWGALGAGWGR
jgi:hypothetical protein